jgi:hypothetical protein
MGVQGLRKFIDGSGASRTVSVPPEGAAAGNSVRGALVDHVLIDMNGLIHSCYTREHTAGAQTIRATLERLTILFKTVVCPCVSLVLAIDGPPPVAKLTTQRMRRRKVRHMDVASGSGFSDLSITVGSTFLLEMEQALSVFLMAAKSEGWLRCAEASVVGSSVIGEGEHKLAHALQLIARDPALYKPDASVVVVGNDIDLILTCMGATAFTSIGVLSPSSLQFVDVGAIMQRWCEGEGAFVRDMSDLASARLDFVLAFLLNGGDHFVGLGDVAVSLWRRYKLLRASNPAFRVFNPTGSKLNVGSFAELIGCEGWRPGSRDEPEEHEPKRAGSEEIDDDIDGPDGEPRRGGKGKGKGKGEKSKAPMSARQSELKDLARTLVDATMWAFAATVRGEIADYREAPPDLSGLTIANLRDAVMGITVNALTFRRHGGQPLAPIVGFAAVMPTIDHMPAAFQAAAAKYPAVAAKLEEAREPQQVVDAVIALWKRVDVAALTPAEKFLTQFGDPVSPICVPAAEGGGQSLSQRWKQSVIPGSKGKERATLPFDATAKPSFTDPLGKRATRPAQAGGAKGQQRRPRSASAGHRRPTQKHRRERNHRD